MQTVTQREYVQKPYLPTCLVRRETHHSLLTGKKINSDLMGLSCLVLDPLEDYDAYPNREGNQS